MQSLDLPAQSQILPIFFKNEKFQLAAWGGLKLYSIKLIFCARCF